mgnify:CR=1 FL=1
MEIAILTISSLALIALCVVICLLVSNKKGDGKKDEEHIQDIVDSSTELIQKDIQDAINTINVAKEALNTTFKVSFDTLNPHLESFDKRVGELTNTNMEKLEAIKDRLSNTSGEISKTLQDEMEKIRKANGEKLDEIKQTVDEKLQTTLEKRIKEAFDQVTTGLAEVQKRFGEMTELSNQVANLNKTFMNVKTRGTWGEVSLEALLEQILAPEQYEKQYAIVKTKTNDERVDFVVKLPGKIDDEVVLLPIDSKFPLEDYNRLVDASERGNRDEVLAMQEALKKAVKEMAKSISSKYIRPPKTTDFAVLYLPTEGLYAEISKDPALTEELRTKFKVIICGPTVLSALLNSFYVGFQTLKIQKNSGEIAKSLIQFQKDFTMFTDLMVRARKNAEGVIKTLDLADDRREKIEKKLSKVGSIAGTLIEDNKTDIKEIGEESIENEGE